MPWNKLIFQLSLETAPLNAGVLMNPKPFLDIIYNQKSICLCLGLENDENDRRINKGRITKWQQ
jgi:hypothetical protein